MKVKYKGKKEEFPKKIKFGDLKIGETFIIINDCGVPVCGSHINIKVSRTSSIFYNNEKWLCDHCIVDIAKENNVKRINSTLVLEDSF